MLLNGLDNLFIRFVPRAERKDNTEREAQRGPVGLQKQAQPTWPERGFICYCYRIIHTYIYVIKIVLQGMRPRVSERATKKCEIDIYSVYVLCGVFCVFFSIYGALVSVVCVFVKAHPHHIHFNNYTIIYVCCGQLWWLIVGRFWFAMYVCKPNHQREPISRFVQLFTYRYNRNITHS